MNNVKRLIVSVLLILAFAVSIWQIPFASYAQKLQYGENRNFGDVDLNGDISMVDALFVIKFCCELQTLTPQQMLNADANCDGRINTSDCVLIMKYVVGICDCLPYVIAPIFTSYTFPKPNERVNYNKSRVLRGVIESEVPLKNVRITVTDVNSETVEIDEKVTFSESEQIKYYDTMNSQPSIDSKVRFAGLSTGKKNIKLICSTTTSTNTCLYEADFFVGYSYSEIAGHVYSGKSPSATEARTVLTLLNGLDYTTVGGKIIAQGINYAGTDYSTLDCSGFVQKTIKNAIDVNLPRTSAEQAEFCTNSGFDVPYSERTTGDLMFMTNLECDCGRYHEIHHSAIYIGKGSDSEYLIESTSSLNGVVIRQIWGDNGGKWCIDTVSRLVG